MLFELNVEWGYFGSMQIEAKNEEEAIAKAMKASLPDGEYLSDSFSVTETKVISATPLETLRALLDTDEIHVTAEEGEAIEAVIALLEAGDKSGAVKALDEMLDSDELNVSTPLGDELVMLSQELR